MGTHNFEIAKFKNDWLNTQVYLLCAMYSILAFAMQENIKCKFVARPPVEVFCLENINRVI